MGIPGTHRYHFFIVRIIIANVSSVNVDAAYMAHVLP